jgi:hypothetical protein
MLAILGLMAILGANRPLATLDIPQRMSTASKLFAPNLDKRRDTLQEICGGGSDDVVPHGDHRVHSAMRASERHQSNMDVTLLPSEGNGQPTAHIQHGRHWRQRK